MQITISWNGTKRESVKELIERMTNQLDLYQSDLVNLLLTVTDLTVFPQLEFWDGDGSLRAKARKAVNYEKSIKRPYSVSLPDTTYLAER